MRRSSVKRWRSRLRDQVGVFAARGGAQVFRVQLDLGADTAGADMLLLPYNFTNGYESVMQAVKEGRLTEKRIDESLSRILSLKEKHGLLPSIRSN